MPPLENQAAQQVQVVVGRKFDPNQALGRIAIFIPEEDVSVDLAAMIQSAIDTLTNISAQDVVLTGYESMGEGDPINAEMTIAEAFTALTTSMSGNIMGLISTIEALDARVTILED